MRLTVYFPYAAELCGAQRLYRKNPSQCVRGKKWQQLLGFSQVVLFLSFALVTVTLIEK